MGAYRLRIDIPITPADIGAEKTPPGKLSTTRYPGISAQSEVFYSTAITPNNDQHTDLRAYDLTSEPVTVGGSYTMGSSVGTVEMKSQY